MAEKKGICKNVVNCTLADKEEVQIVDDMNFVCSECNAPLEEVPEKKKKKKDGDDDPNKNKRKLIVLIAAVVAIIGVGVGAYFFLKGGTEPPLEFKVSINKYELEMKEGDSDTLQVMCQPVDAEMAVQYASDNESVAMVTSSGVVHAAGKGDATIRVISQLTNGQRDTFQVGVKVSTNVTVKITKENLSLKKGGKETIKVECQPEDADVTISYASDNEKVAKVTSDGVVSAVGKGNATIRVTAQSSDDKIDSFLVKVNVSENGGMGVGTEVTKVTKDLGWCRYTGPMKGGKPHGIGGTVKVKRSYDIDLKDGRGSMLQVYPGETIVNTKFVNGHLRQGELHRNDGTRKWFNI